MRQPKSTSELSMRNHYQVPTMVGIALIFTIGGCAPAQSGLVSSSVDGTGASTLPPPASTSTAINTPTALQMGESLSLPALLEEHDLELWDVAGEAHPITAEILNNEATYGAVLDELQATLQRAENDVRAIEAGGGTVFVELRWNGASSYSDTTEIEVFYRDAQDPDHRIWIEDSDSTFITISADDVSVISEVLPGEVPTTWNNPVRFMYLDDPWDDRARGMQVVDTDGEPVAFLSAAENHFQPWKIVGPQRYKLVNGFDIDFYGFSEDDLELLWESFAWIELGLTDAPERMHKVVSIRSTELPESIAGVGGRGDIRIDPESLSFMRETLAAPRQADVLWIAGLIVHEAAHVNQPGECTPEYAAAQGMSLQEFALFRETAEGQAYDQEVQFIENLLELDRQSGNTLIPNLEARDNLASQAEFLQGVIGKAVFPNGEFVPTCAE
jgi:hypothetical protein